MAEFDESRGSFAHTSGHRDRLRSRFRQVGGEALADYELLELLLYRSIPRRDTKPISKDLIKRFGSFSQVLAAPIERLCEIDGVGSQVALDLKAIFASAQRLSKEQIKERHVLQSWSSVITYCRAAMAFSEREEFRILFLDKKNGLITDELQQHGTVDHTPVYIREVLKRALEVGATALILVHNHPSGDPTPSRADIQMTKQLCDAARPLNILIHDHIIVGRDGHISFRGLDLMT